MLTPGFTHLIFNARQSVCLDFGWVREGGEVTRYFCIVGNCHSLTVVAVAHFDTHLAGRHLVAIERDDDCFSRLQLLFVINILQNRVQFDPRSLKKLICP